LGRRECFTHEERHNYSRPQLARSAGAEMAPSRNGTRRVAPEFLSGVTLPTTLLTVPNHRLLAAAAARTAAPLTILSLPITHTSGRPPHSATPRPPTRRVGARHHTQPYISRACNAVSQPLHRPNLLAAARPSVHRHKDTVRRTLLRPENATASAVAESP
jgi:hypothetical protein